MSNRVYLATSHAGLKALHDDGMLPADALEPFFPDDAAEEADEEAEYDAMLAAAERAVALHGAALVVAAEVDFGAGDEATSVPLANVASFHVGAELAWYATQELDALL